jgi:hypothetical protein
MMRSVDQAAVQNICAEHRRCLDVAALELRTDKGLTHGEVLRSTGCPFDDLDDGRQTEIH